MLLNACKKDVYLEVSSNNYNSYYPVEIGYWIEYQADSIIHLSNDDINLVDTSIVAYHFYIREEIDRYFALGIHCYLDFKAYKEFLGKSGG